MDWRPPVNLFNHNSFYPNLLLEASPKSLLRFLSNMENSDEWIKFLEKFIPFLWHIEKNLTHSEIEKLSKKILTVDVPLRAFRKPYRNIIMKELYHFYLNDNKLTTEFIIRALKNFQKLNDTSIYNNDLFLSLNPIFDFFLTLRNESNGDGWKNKNYEEILTTLFDLNLPLQLFTHDYNYTFLLKHP